MHKNKTVLIIEDDRAIRALLHDFLGLYGFETRSVNNGLSALTALKKTYFDIIIADYSMPVMDGIEFIKAIRPQFPGVLIIGISGNCGREDFLQAGADAFLPKPFDLLELLSLIEEGNR